MIYFFPWPCSFSTCGIKIKAQEKIRKRKDSAGSDDTASMIKGEKINKSGIL
jgi:hypothetical protein